jgi:hypothetical protein
MGSEEWQQCTLLDSDATTAQNFEQHRGKVKSLQNTIAARRRVTMTCKKPL